MSKIFAIEKSLCYISVLLSKIGERTDRLSHFKDIYVELFHAA